MNRRFPVALSLAIGILLFLPQVCAEDEVVIENIRPNKILYSLNENASARVTLTNKSAAGQNGTLVLTELRGVDGSRNVGRIPVTLAGGQTGMEIVAAWNVGPEMYGREIRVDFVSDGKKVSSASEFYHVADKWLRVNMITGWKPAPEDPQDRGIFESYQNHKMYFCWAPCNFSDLTPDLDTWYSGYQSYGPYNAKGFKAQLSNLQRKGIRTSSYLRYEACGPAGFEFARRHPEWIVRKRNGSYHLSYHSLSPIELAGTISDKPSLKAQTAVVDFYEAAPVVYGAQEAAASAKMFGWDAMFFDGGCYYVYPGFSWDGQPTPHGQNPNELTARNVRLFRETVRKEFPDLVIWHNGMSPSSVNRPFDSLHGNHGGLEASAAVFEDPDSGRLIEEQGGGFIRKPWAHWYDFYADRRDEVKDTKTVLNSGWLWNYGLNQSLNEEEIKASREAYAAASHTGAIFTAFGIHPCWNITYGARPFAQFMTRYSTLLWDTDIDPVEDAEKVFKVVSERELWWKRSAYVKQNERETLYLVHLLNKPTTEMPDWKEVGDPPAAEDVSVTLNVPVGKDVEKAWALRPYQWKEVPQTPVQRELEIENTEGGIKVGIPAFRYHTLVVFKMKR